jgi:hypothetical protein
MLYALHRIGYHSRATVHGFRTRASTALNEMGFLPDVIERQLAHQERNAVRADWGRCCGRWQSSSYAAGVAAAGGGGIALRTIFETEQADP